MDELKRNNNNERASRYRQSHQASLRTRHDILMRLLVPARWHPAPGALWVCIPLHIDGRDAFHMRRVLGAHQEVGAPHRLDVHKHVDRLVLARLPKPHQLRRGAAKRKRVVQEGPAVLGPARRARCVEHLGRVSRQVDGAQLRGESAPQPCGVQHKVVQRPGHARVAPKVVGLRRNVVRVPDVQRNQRLARALHPREPL
eukprot:scaffold13732_cov147-Isochrysis_galbana.AAC.4